MSRTSPCLVFDASAVADDANVLGFEKALRRSGRRRGFQAEVAVIEAWYGPNAYSDFLLKHGCRPDPDQATAIGRLIGAMVKASDGRMYPSQYPAERKALRLARREASVGAKTAAEILRLRKAIAGLAANTRDPAEVIKDLSVDLDEPEIRAQLQDAIRWLTRFAEEWHLRETVRTDGNPRPT